MPFETLASPMSEPSPTDEILTTTALFPTFTQHLLRELGDGRSINLTGSHEQGIGRLLDDLCQAKPPGVKIIRVDLHDYRLSHAGLVDRVWRMVQESGAINARGAKPQSLVDCGDRLRLAEGEVLWLILERFDLLFDRERDEKYHCEFFRDEINSLRNHRQRVLISHTTRPHHHYSIHCAPNQPLLSPPDLQLESLPSLGEREMRAELQRRLPGLAAPEITQVVEWVKGTGEGYALFEHLIRRLEPQADADRPLSERLKGWSREYQSLHSRLNLGQITRLSRRLRYRLGVFGKLALDWVKDLSLWGKLVALVRSWWERWRGRSR